MEGLGALCIGRCPILDILKEYTKEHGKIILIHLTEKEAKYVLEALEFFLDKNEHNLVDFPDYWKPRFENIERVIDRIRSKLGLKEE